MDLADDTTGTMNRWLCHRGWPVYECKECPSWIYKILFPWYTIPVLFQDELL